MASIYVSFLNFMSSILEMRIFTHFLCNCVHLFTNPKNNSQLRLREVINQFCTNMENVADIADMSVMVGPGRKFWEGTQFWQMDAVKIFGANFSG